MHNWQWNFLGISILWIVWIPLLIFFIWLIIRDKTTVPLKETPMEVLKRKFANGEITAEEYERGKQLLDSK